MNEMFHKVSLDLGDGSIDALTSAHSKKLFAYAPVLIGLFVQEDAYQEQKPENKAAYLQHRLEEVLGIPIRIDTNNGAFSIVASEVQAYIAQLAVGTAA